MQSHPKEVTEQSATLSRPAQVREELLALAARLRDEPPRIDLAALERARVRAEAALGTCRAAAAQAQAVLESIEALQAAAAAAAPPARMRQVELDEAIAHAAKAPPPPTAKPPVDLKSGIARLQRNDPDFTRRVVGAAAPVEQPRKAPHRTYTHEARLRSARHNPKHQQYEAALAKAKAANATSRAGYRLALNTLKNLHGDEIAHFIAHKMLGDAPNTTAIGIIVGRMMGPYPSRREAEEACAQHHGEKAIADLRAGRDVLRRYAAGLTLEHEDGRCSWFRA